MRRTPEKRRNHGRIRQVGLEKQYLQEQLRRVGAPGPKVLGIDEISLRKGHTYRIVVSHLFRRRPIWFGGPDRSQASLELFFKELGIKKCRGIYLAVMALWKPFRDATLKHAPAAPRTGPRCP